MKIDFLNNSFRNFTCEKVFGLCDDIDTIEKTPAYIDCINIENWICRVDNFKEKKIFFTSIDHGLIKNRKDIDNPERCDLMLDYENVIIFVELKNKKKKTAKISQLENTIRLFNLNHDLSNYELRKAYLSNKKCTATLKHELKDSFPDNNFGFRIYFDNEINIE